jgi:ribosomal protein S18 acetylase RimI-like enzyme
LKVRAATVDDVRDAAALHCRAFAGFFLSSLGLRFLARFYLSHINIQHARLLVATDESERLMGFVSGSCNAATFYRSLRWRDGAILALFALPALILNPRTVASRFWSAIRYSGDQPRALPLHWLLSSLAVDPNLQGAGVGTRLVSAFFTHARAAGAPGVYLVTDGDDNTPVLEFYRRQGFIEVAAQVRGDGRRLLTLAKEF